MKKIFKRLKIVEQIAIVTIISVVTPMVIAGFIVNNVNQHAIRRELGSTATMIAKTIDNNINSLLESDDGKLKEVILALKYLPSEYIEDVYLKDVVINSHIFKKIVVWRPSEHNGELPSDERYTYSLGDNYFTITEKIHNDKYLVAFMEANDFKNRIFNNITDNNRRIYIINDDRELLFAYNFSEENYQKILHLLPHKLQTNEPITFSKVKNQPLVYLKMGDKQATVIVETTEEMTAKTINTARAKIILAILVAVGFILSMVGAYTYYLYINVRQLFKGVIAISKGNYKRQIRLLTNVFTPYEIVFLASEFNKMVNEINLSYKQLKQKNKEMKLLSDFRSNLVDTVSHEFRTPLTSIQGYTSRLLRQDIVIDEQTQHKSLMIIKQQCERLTRMVEDLLVVPDIEGAKLNIQLDNVTINDVLASSIISVRNIEKHVINNQIPQNFPKIIADKDRLEQVFINLIENAIKYAYEDSSIEINAGVENEQAIISISNKSDYIEKLVLDNLFEKFTRVEYETTRTTRGTGLGLFIVKGLVNAMHGSIHLKSTKDNVFTVKVMLPLAKDTL